MANFNLAAHSTVGAAAKPALSKTSVAAALAGNVLEFYDFTTYSFFAVMIGEAGIAATLMLPETKDAPLQN